MSISSICFQKLARRRSRSVGFLESVVATPRAWHTPEKTDRRFELGRFSRFSKLMPRRRLGLGSFRRFIAKGWQNDSPGHSSTCTSDLYRRRVRLSRLSPSAGRAGPGRAGSGRTVQGRYRRPAGLRNATGGKASAHATGPGFGMRPAAGLRNATRLRRTRPGQVSARRFLN